MQYYIRGAWRTISDPPQAAKPSDRSDSTSRGQSQTNDSQDSNASSISSGQQGVVPDRPQPAKRELSDEMKESLTFLRNSEGDWETILRRISSRESKDVDQRQQGRESAAEHCAVSDDSQRRTQ